MLLVTGAGGQMGQALARLIPKTQVHLRVTSADLDITDADACLRLCEDRQVTAIINAAAYTKVDQAESEPERTFAVNEAGARNLARAAGRVGATLVHVSTDYVFDGTGNTPYDEQAAVNPQTVYGRSKRAGEVAVLESDATTLVLRTAWLYGPDGHNFARTMLRLGRERAELGVVVDQVGTPTYVDHLARDILALLPQVQSGQRELYHYSDEGVASWYDFAVAIMREAALPCQVQPIATRAYPTPAARPAYSVLDKSCVKKRFGLRLNHWHEGVQACVARLQAG